MQTQVPAHTVMQLRMSIGTIWLAGASFNAFWTFRHASAFTDDLASAATFAVYRWFFGEVVAASPAFWIVMLIFGEFALGMLTLGGGTLARIGLAGSVLFSLFLFIIIWPYTLMMGMFALVALWLLRSRHPMSAIDFLLG